MKVLYLAHFTEGRGWANASENYVRSLKAVGVDVVCRPVLINGSRMPSQDIVELCNKPVAGTTHVIQHTMPNFWDYSSKVKNIGLFVTETDSIKYTHWENKIKCMDQVWVPNVEMHLDLKPVHARVVPHAADMSVYNKEYKQPNLPQFKNRFVFYFVGENIKRKRINAILTAYYTAFDCNDDVVLIIKTGRDGQASQETVDDIIKTSNQIKGGMRLYRNRDLFPELVVIPENIPFDELCGLHQFGHCFVNGTFGDAWNQPCFDAFAFGNTIISPLHGGMKQYLNGAMSVFPVDFTKEICFGADPFLPDLHTARENWYTINIRNFADQMKRVYDLEKTQKVAQHKELAKRYSYENIGELMLQMLEK
jgi:glycosyltransferase involved in cell wall biosynthesis